MTKIMQRTAITINDVSILQFLSTVKLVDHVLEVDGFVLQAFRPDRVVGGAWHVASLAITCGVMPVAAMQAQVSVAVFALGIINHHPPVYRHGIGDCKALGDVLILIFRFEFIVLTRVDDRISASFNTQCEGTHCIIGKFGFEPVFPVGPNRLRVVRCSFLNVEIEVSVGAVK